MSALPLMLGTAKPILAEDIGVAAFPAVPAESPLRALCKPAFSPFDPAAFLSGTEDQTGTENQLVFGRIDFKAKRTDVLPDGGSALWTHSVPQHVRDVHWLAPTHALAALGNRLAVLRVSCPASGAFDCDVVMLPQVHTDTLREVAVHPYRPNLVLSGGFDGFASLVDIVKVMFLHCLMPADAHAACWLLYFGIAVYNDTCSYHAALPARSHKHALLGRRWVLCAMTVKIR
jgi:hypothetical protein